jgi:hypothetical protein
MGRNVNPRQVLDAATGRFLRYGMGMSAPRARVAGGTVQGGDGGLTLLVAAGADGHEASEALTLINS